MSFISNKCRYFKRQLCSLGLLATLPAVSWCSWGCGSLGEHACWGENLTLILYLAASARSVLHYLSGYAANVLLEAIHHSTLCIGPCSGMGQQEQTDFDLLGVFYSSLVRIGSWTVWISCLIWLGRLRTYGCHACQTQSCCRGHSPDTQGLQHFSFRASNGTCSS